MTKNVYLVQANHLYGKNAFLPYSAGLLQAYAQSRQAVRDNYQFMPIIFQREEVSRVLARMYQQPPAVLGISCYIWNYNYSHALAMAVKANFPDCVVVAGGPHIPVADPTYFERHPSVDCIVHHEGEKAFAYLLEKIADGSWVKGQKKILDYGRIDNLDELPSPYLTGVFDVLMAMNPGIDFHATQETHRGCPYACTFCDWGSAVMTKLRKFCDDRIYSELRWMTLNKIEMVYNADANYGIFPRDLNLTRAMTELKAEHGYPKKFRAAYAKNSNDVIFEHAKMLHEAGMNKGITLSFQSLDKKTLEIVKRDNIKITDFERLMKKYKRAGIATYTELILGLPGETYDSFVDGMCLMLDAGQHESLQVYTCEVLPNSEMNDPGYKETHGIQFVRGPIPMFHGTPVEDELQEYYELVVGTRSMPTSDWLRAQMFAWAVQTFHCLGLTRLIAIALYTQGISYRHFYEAILNEVPVGDVQTGGLIAKVMRQAVFEYTRLRAGEEWGSYSPIFGEIVWPPEEASFLHFITKKDVFYAELRQIIRSLAPGVPEEIVDDLFAYQETVIAHPFSDFSVLDCHYDWKAFFEEQPTRIFPERDTTFKILNKPHPDLETFAREVVWYGRKGGSFMNQVERYVQKG